MLLAQLVVLFALVRATNADEDPATLFAKATRAAQQGDAEAADALLQQLPAEHAAEALMKRGNIAAFMRRDIEGGVKLYRQSIEADASRWDAHYFFCLLYTSPSPRDATLSRMPSSA